MNSLDAVLDQVADWPVGSAAVAVVGADGTRAARGDAEQTYAWASVTKLLTALTVLVAVQRSRVELDEPAGPPGSTVRHLLSHASGLAPDGDRVLARPARSRIYSNRGFELLADLVEQRTAEPFAEHLGREVCEPLGMTGTVLRGSPAHGAHGPLQDLAGLARQLLRPTLVAPDLMGEATSTAFPGLAGVLPGFGRQDPNDWGLGFEIRGAKQPHWTGARNSPATFGHFGRSGSFLWLDPEAGLGCVGLADREFGPWAATAWPALADGVLGAAATAGGGAR